MMDAVSGRLFSDGAGWFRWTPDPEPGTEVRVHLESIDGRQRIARIEISGEISAKALRSIPVGRIEATANSLFDGGDAGALGPDAELTPRTRISVDGGWEVHTDEVHDRPEPQSQPPASLLLPDTQPHERKPEHFYEAVAALYRSLAIDSSRPAAMIAEANDVPVTTVHRWVKEARRREFLPPGRSGAAG